MSVPSGLRPGRHEVTCRGQRIGQRTSQRRSHRKNERLSVLDDSLIEHRQSAFFSCEHPAATAENRNRQSLRDILPFQVIQISPIKPHTADTMQKMPSQDQRLGRIQQLPGQAEESRSETLLGWGVAGDSSGDLTTARTPNASVEPGARCGRLINLSAFPPSLKSRHHGAAVAGADRRGRLAGPQQ